MMWHNGSKELGRQQMWEATRKPRKRERERQRQRQGGGRAGDIAMIHHSINPSLSDPTDHRRLQQSPIPFPNATEFQPTFSPKLQLFQPFLVNFGHFRELGSVSRCRLSLPIGLGALRATPQQLPPQTAISERK
ncbi:hypothetical protein KC19_1G315700 [Ceratodon purpureus]|uniref:Uncharacterized protein n=1 Tax=Ceratodon purpureus TaxID=3225 RepID=A0A8T0JEC9_CERPU|nr:hypothetical protein KC19_1G315700 [Ceratodon purpureus]